MMNNSKINIFHLRDTCGLYGAERVVLGISKFLDKKYYDTTIITFDYKNNDTAAFYEALKKEGIKIISIPSKSKFNLKTVAFLRRMIKEHSVDIVHSHDYKANFYNVVSTFFLKAKKVVTSHGSTRDSFIKRFYLFFDEILFYRFFDKIISVSDEITSALLKKGIRKDKIVRVENGIDIASLENSEDRSDKQEIVKRDENKFVFGVVGRLFPDKGHRYFFDALKNIISEFPQIDAIIAGDGPLRTELVNYSKSIEVDSHVHIIGASNNIGSVYKNLDCIVIPSLTEGLPYVLLESMFLKIPVIASSVGEIPKLVVNGQTGYLVQPGNINDLEESMKKVICNNKNAKNMADNAYSFVKNKYSAENMAMNIQKVYSELLS